MNLIWWSECPHGRPKLQDLRRDTCGVVNIILRPTDNLPQVVGTGRKAVISTWKIGKPSHLSVLPNKSKIDKACARRSGVKRGAAPRFAQWIRCRCLRNAGDDAGVPLYRPGDIAVGSAQRAEIGEQAISPQRGVAALVSREIRVAGEPLAIVYAVSAAVCAA